MKVAPRDKNVTDDQCNRSKQMTDGDIAPRIDITSSSSIWPEAIWHRFITVSIVTQLTTRSPFYAPPPPFPATNLPARTLLPLKNLPHLFVYIILFQKVHTCEHLEASLNYFET